MRPCLQTACDDSRALRIAHAFLDEACNLRRPGQGGSHTADLALLTEVA